MKKIFKLRTPDGTVLDIDNLSKFCKEKGINYGSIVRGSQSSGYVLADKAKKKVKLAQKRYLYEVITPDGEEILVDNLSEFCRERGLTIQNLNACANGRVNSHRGYQCSKICEIGGKELLQLLTMESKPITKTSKKRYKVTKPDGSSVIVNNLVRFCLDNDLSDSSAFLCLSGKLESHKGFKFKRLKDKK